jgi:hypothetical protein
VAFGYWFFFCISWSWGGSAVLVSFLLLSFSFRLLVRLVCKMQFLLGICSCLDVVYFIRMLTVISVLQFPGRQHFQEYIDGSFTRRCRLLPRCTYHRRC